MTTLIETALTYFAGMSVPIVIGAYYVWYEQQKEKRKIKTEPVSSKQVEERRALTWVTGNQASLFLEENGVKYPSKYFYPARKKEISGYTLYCKEDLKTLVVKNQTMSLEDVMDTLNITYDDVLELDKNKTIESVKVFDETRYTKESVNNLSKKN